MSRQERSRVYRMVAHLLRPPLRALAHRDWQGGGELPTEGGFVTCANHVSNLDPLTLAHFLHDSGHPPYFLAKEELFRAPVVGRILRAAEQIPVRRGSGDASLAFAAAVGAVQAGKCVVIFPEATLTRDPGLWPMVGKTGAARVALSTGCPVIPVAQWGAQDILAPRSSRPDLLPRKRVQVLAGPPVDLDDLIDQPINAALLAEATDRIMTAITGLLEQLRGEPAPPVRYRPDPGVS